ncbi:hypothetical protein QR685DRAFT_317631 [Neurospora intermedia]|uniref:Glycosyltransferase family 1 protein n=1 Tax=Neurospora intermedia TaxID=5142 RepID=A0ABR3D854_NEUIN
MLLSIAASRSPPCGRRRPGSCPPFLDSRRARYPISLSNQRACLHVGSPLRPDLSRPICAPQRAILDHPSTTLFVTHVGPSSANEALFLGVPMVSMPFCGYQIQHNLRLVAAGVAKGVGKNIFTPAQLASTISAMMVDSDGKMHIIFSSERSASLV